MTGLFAILALFGLFQTLVSPYSHLGPVFTARQNPTDPNPWVPASEIPGAVRSPCPGTNTLANHGFINRDGKNITMQAYQQAFSDAFQMALVSTQSGAQNAINLCKRLTGKTCTAFDLDMLNTPHAIEHDASLSREDKEMWYGEADNEHFNQTIWDMTLAAYGNNTHVNIPLANTARVRRIQQAKVQDAPGWFIQNDQTSATEAAFYLYTMNDPTVANWSFPQARLDWINYWFVNEQLPTALGWTKPSAFPTAANGKGYILSIKDRVIAAKTISSISTSSSTSAAATSSTFTSTTGMPSATTTSATVVRAIRDAGSRIHVAERQNVPAIENIQPLPNRPGRSASASSLASAVATAEASPPPHLPNTYNTVVSAQQFAALEPVVKHHIQEVKGYYKKALAMLLNPPQKSSRAAAE